VDKPFRKKREGERVPEIHNKEVEVPKAGQLFHNNPKDDNHMQHPQEEVLIVYGFSQAEHKRNAFIKMIMLI
jgi:hypothetical protein